MLRVGLSGTNWTGKTETIGRFVKEHPELNIETISLSALVDQCPYPMMEAQTLESSQWMVEQVRVILNNHGDKIQVFDRTPLDILAFTLYSEDRMDEKRPEIISSIIELFKYFDYIFYFPLSDEWPLNICAAQDKIDFALQIDCYMCKAIEHFSLEIILLPWQIDERKRLLSEYLLGFASI